MKDPAPSEAGRAFLSVVIATENRGKLTELRALLSDLPIELLPLSAVLPSRTPVVEDGATLEENATLKARAAAASAKLVTIADDSGLEIDALDARPGVRSARFAKEGATDAENNAAVLKALEEVLEPQRGARFRCVLAMVDPWSDGEPQIVEGRCEGAIARQTSGAGGFGYDPLFVVRGYERTMAELTEGEKSVVSHRARAVAALRPHLEALLERRLSAAARIANDG